MEAFAYFMSGCGAVRRVPQGGGREKVMKRIKAFAALLMAVSLLAGCGGESKSDGAGSRLWENGYHSGGRNDSPAEGGYAGGDGFSIKGDVPIAGAGEMRTEAADEAPMEMPMEPENLQEGNTEEYNALEEPGFKAVKNSPVSTFSADVDTASYTNLRRMIEQNLSIEDIPQGAVRIEELLNYFKYDYNLPADDSPFGVTTVVGDCPWNKDAKLLQIGLKTEEIDFSEAPSSNLVFLLDVSGSMNDADKLPLLQSAFTMLTDELTEKDRVSIVTYAGSDAVLLEGEKGSNKTEIAEVINSLRASGSTNGSAGIETAYRLAEENFIEGGNNRIILATDGDLNVGTTSESALKELVTEKRKSGIFLSVLGFGTGNIKDNKMEALADNGNGNYAYIDSRGEAKRVMVEEMGATLVTVAKDVKLQIEFNPAYIKGYRLLGYENRTLATEDFDDDTKDAGEIGAGHIVTALYEIVPVDSRQEVPETNLRYQETVQPKENGEWALLKIRFKEPEADESILKEYIITEEAYRTEPNEDFYFAAAVAEFGLLVRDSKYKGEASFRNIENLLAKVNTAADDYKDEFTYLVKKLKRNSPEQTEPQTDSRRNDSPKSENMDSDGINAANAGEICGYPLAEAGGISAEAEGASEKAERQAKEQGGEVTCSHENLQISLNLPTGWEYETEEYSEDGGRFGIRFFPEGVSGSVGLYYYDFFGVCGTGLETRELTLEGGRKGRMGLYDGSDLFSFITFPEETLSAGSFVASNEGADDWLAEHEDEVLQILGAAVMAEE